MMDDHFWMGLHPYYGKNASAFQLRPLKVTKIDHYNTWTNWTKWADGWVGP